MIEENLKDLVSAKIQTNLGIKWMKEEEDGTLTFIDRFYYSKMTESFQGSDIEDMISNMFIQIKTQVEDSKLPDSEFVIDKILHLDISFRKLNLTRGSSYLPLPKWISKKKCCY